MKKKADLILKNKKLLNLLQTSYLAYKNGVEIYFIEEYNNAENKKVTSFKEFIEIFNIKIFSSLTKLIEKENFDLSEIIYDFYYPRDKFLFLDNSKYFVTNKKILISNYSNDFSGNYTSIDIKKIKSVEFSKWTGKLDILLLDDSILSVRRNFLWSAPSKYIIDHIIHISDGITNQIKDMVANEQEVNYWLCLSCLEKNSNESDTCSACGTPNQKLELTMPETAVNKLLQNLLGIVLSTLKMSLILAFVGTLANLFSNIIDQPFISVLIKGFFIALPISFIITIFTRNKDN